jgi:aminoglycoside phosphotransferase (APT) family kinase protein
MHEDEIEIADDAAQHLISSQFPVWSMLPIRRIQSSGTVNAIFRIGDDLAARFPLRPGEPEEVRRDLEDEAKANANFARHSPFPSPTSVAIGEPGIGYPLPWSVQTWLSGSVAADVDPPGNEELALDLAVLITALRKVDTKGRTFEHGWRGGDLRKHDEWVQTCLLKSEGILDVPTLTALWSHFVELPRTAPDVMSHGDLTPSNVLVADGRLVGILDCGGFGPADPALDLIAGWHLLDDAPRALFRNRLEVNDLECERSMAWAFEQSMGAVWYYEKTNPSMAEMGRRTLSRIVADAHGSLGI